MYILIEAVDMYTDVGSRTALKSQDQVLYFCPLAIRFQMCFVNFCWNSRDENTWYSVHKSLKPGGNYPLGAIDVRNESADYLCPTSIKNYFGWFVVCMVHGVILMIIEHSLVIMVAADSLL